MFTRISQYDIHSAQFRSFGPTGKSASRCKPTNFSEREFFLTSFRDPRPGSNSPTPNQCVHKNPRLVSISGQINPVDASQPIFFKIYFNIIVLFNPRSPQRCRSFRFPNHSFVYMFVLPHACHMPRLCRPL